MRRQIFFQTFSKWEYFCQNGRIVLTKVYSFWGKKWKTNPYFSPNFPMIFAGVPSAPKQFIDHPSCAVGANNSYTFEIWTNQDNIFVEYRGWSLFDICKGKYITREFQNCLSWNIYQWYHKSQKCVTSKTFLLTFIFINQVGPNLFQ